MNNIPKKIYLQIGDDVETSDNFKNLEGVTWANERVNNSDIEYTLTPAKEDKGVGMKWSDLEAAFTIRYAGKIFNQMGNPIPELMKDMFNWFKPHIESQSPSDEQRTTRR